MKEHNVPDWYIESCYKIKYMFPKAHAAAYMIATLRLGWYKVHYPVEYYAAYFTVRSEDFDGATAVQGRAAVQRRMRELEQKQKEHQSTVKEDAAYSTFQIINEMLCRGIELLPVTAREAVPRRPRRISFSQENFILIPFSKNNDIYKGCCRVYSRQQSPDQEFPFYYWKFTCIMCPRETDRENLSDKRKGFRSSNRGCGACG